MSSLNKKLAVVRVTTLAAVLMGVYGTAAAAPGYSWIEYLNDVGEYTINGGSIITTGGPNKRGVLSTGASTVTLNGVTISTDADGSWGAHGAGANGSNSTLNILGGTITTNGQYSNGIQAENGGTVTGNGVGITATGGSSYTFGVEAGDGGKVDLVGGSINVSGVVAAGARAYTGTGKSRRAIFIWTARPLTSPARHP
ncbi:hypothetical protein [Eoetvoesiella caeni]